MSTVGPLVVEAVCVCSGYSDFLSAVLPHNLAVLDRLVVVTSPTDEATRELCRQWSLECLVSADGQRNGDPFNKGRLVERGLEQLAAGSWHLQLDADVALPLRARTLLQAADLDPAAVYGCDRLMVKGWEQWQEVLRSGYLTRQHDYQNRLTFPPGIPIGARWVDIREGYVPIGFFQLWHADQEVWRGTRIRRYSAQHNSACRTDVQHGLTFDRRQRILLPELVAVHLESEPGPQGVNWTGRKTKPFGPPGTAGGKLKTVS